MVAILDKPGVQPVLLPMLPLESGDRLTRAQFERCNALSHRRRAGVCEGIVQLPSPMRIAHQGAGLAAVQQGVQSVDHGQYIASLQAEVAQR